MNSRNSLLTPWFIGSYGENDDLFESLLSELITEHIAWRNEKHTKFNAPYTEQRSTAEFKDSVNQMKLHISNLIKELKSTSLLTSASSSGSIKSELLLPGLIAQILAVLYNPTKSRGKVEPISINMELEAGRDIAQMLGYNIKVEHQPCAWGHITSGGNTANYDSLRNARAISCYPLALKSTAKNFDIDLTIHPTSNKLIVECSSWECQNFSVDEVIDLEKHIKKQLRQNSDKNTMNKFFNQLHLNRVEQMGMSSFFAKHWDAKQPLVLVPATHYKDWKEALNLLGFGSNHLIKLDVNKQMRLDIDSLERVLVNAELKKIPILSVIGILGTTEFGSIDSIAEIVQLRNRFKEKGLNFYFHIDASWAGYFCSLLRNEDGTTLTYKEIKGQFKYFPSQSTYNAFATIKEADSVTVDPHKMGYLPIGAGAFISRNREMTNITLENSCSDETIIDLVEQKNKQLSQYILNGVRPGTAAISCCLTQRILPLNNKHFGQILRESILASEYFYDRIKSTIDGLKQLVNVVLPMEPDSNIFCLGINPINNHSLTRMNRFTQRVYEQLHSLQEIEGQDRAFFCTTSSIEHSSISTDDSKDFLNNLGIKQTSFVMNIEDPKFQCNRISILRHSLLNPWLLRKIEGKNAIDRYCDFFADTVQEVANKESSTMLIAVSSRQFNKAI